MANGAVFLDRDGTIAKDVHYCSCPEDFGLLSRAGEGIKLLNEAKLKVIVITNQSGIARGYFTEEILERIHQKMRDDLAKYGAYVDAIYYCPHHPEDGCECRKPRPKLVLQATSDFELDLLQSYVIGDLEMDIKLGRNVECKTLLISNMEYDVSTLVDNQVEPDAIVPSLFEAVKIILKWEKSKRTTT